MKFYNDVRDKLGHRQDGFDYIFEYLKTKNNPFIVETGCARQLDNYSGDGQSSLLFDKYIKEYGGYFWTVDISEESVNYSKSQMTSDNSVVTLGDSITKLKDLNTILLQDNNKIDFLYLDSFDAPRDNPEVLFLSALHHMYELTTIKPSLTSGALICVDDNWIDNDKLEGKGKIIFDYMQRLGIEPCAVGYQMFWRIE
jgi:hypothetical protein